MPCFSNFISKWWLLSLKMYTKYNNNNYYWALFFVGNWFIIFYVTHWLTQKLEQTGDALSREKKTRKKLEGKSFPLKRRNKQTIQTWKRKMNERVKKTSNKSLVIEFWSSSDWIATQSKRQPYRSVRSLLRRHQDGMFLILMARQDIKLHISISKDNAAALCAVFCVTVRRIELV